MHFLAKEGRQFDKLRTLSSVCPFWLGNAIWDRPFRRQGIYWPHRPSKLEIWEWVEGFCYHNGKASATILNVTNHDIRGAIAAFAAA